MKKYYAKLRRGVLVQTIIGVALVLFMVLISYNSEDAKELRRYFGTKDQLMDNYDTQLKPDTWYVCDREAIINSYASNNDGVGFICMISHTEDSISLMGFFVPNKDVEKATKLSDATYEWLTNETEIDESLYLRYRGYVRDMYKEEKEYFQKAALEMGVSEEELDYLCYKTFEPVSAGKMLSDYLGDHTIRVIIFLTFLTYALYNIIALASGGYKRRIKKTIAENGLNEDLVAYDLDSGEEYRSVQLGKKYALFNGENRLLILEQLVWGYVHLKKTKHYAYGFIPTGTSTEYKVMLVQSDKKTIEKVAASEEDAYNILDRIKQAAPYALYGYDENLDHIRRTNFPRLLQMRNERILQAQETPVQKPVSSGWNMIDLAPDTIGADIPKIRLSNNESENAEPEEAEPEKTEKKLNEMEKKAIELSSINWDEDE